jgi:uncharacterized Zn finger protein
VNAMCPKCSSNKIAGVVIEDDPKQPIVHYLCEACGYEWVE